LERAATTRACTPAWPSSPSCTPPSSGARTPRGYEGSPKSRKNKSCRSRTCRSRAPRGAASRRVLGLRGSLLPGLAQDLRDGFVERLGDGVSHLKLDERAREGDVAQDGDAVVVRGADDLRRELAFAARHDDRGNVAFFFVVAERAGDVRRVDDHDARR